MFSIINLKYPPQPWMRKRSVTKRPLRYLITFYSGKPLKAAADRFMAQAVRVGWFDQVDIFFPDADSPLMRKFAEIHGEYVRNNPRGYGYWIWKSYLVDEILSGLPLGSHLYYMDIGCELSAFGEGRFNFLDDYVDRHGVLFFQMPFLEKAWNKMETALAILGHWDHQTMDTGQIQATWFALKKSDDSMSLVTEWRRWCLKDGGYYLTDSCDPDLQHAAFIGHRHDQAILSLIVKRRGYSLFTCEDRFDKALYVPNSWVLLAPVHGLRSRGAHSYINRIMPLSTEEHCLANLDRPSAVFCISVCCLRFFNRGMAVLSKCWLGAKNSFRIAFGFYHF